MVDATLQSCNMNLHTHDPEFVVRFYPLARQGGYSSVVQLAVASACAAAQRRRLAAQTHEFFFFLLFRVPVLSPIWPL